MNESFWLRSLQNANKKMVFSKTRRALLKTSCATFIINSIIGFQALASQAAINKISWRINASSFASGINRFFKLVHSSSISGGSFPISSLLWYFPLNIITPDGFKRLGSRGEVRFTTSTATSKSKYDSLDFVDASIGNITVVLPEIIEADYFRDGTSVKFNFRNSLPQIIIWKIPQELKVPKSLRVQSIKFSEENTLILLSNSVNTQLLEINLFVEQKGSQGVQVASSGPMEITNAFTLLARSSTICCNGNCVRDDGAIGSENDLNKYWSIIQRITPPHSGQCYLRLVEKDTPPLDVHHREIAAGFRTMEAASDALNTKYRDECTPRN
ncbi:hypothetical protein [Pseudoduganella umbonata]|uniref:Uncharacterized protein n=1 Tax=Pseudoduganella umbonata TaxID=864828 RepID=A0A4P8HXJ8_9BURK|nr:hypothetical protein [Pseudoduganella umbonata]MBB3224481.1 hypothetical protein [Pseudoduganella umbonata]QCP13254.1 hypothetical protein FCL38_24605 [Pseudoduganella umbonata]